MFPISSVLFSDAWNEQVTLASITLSPYGEGYFPKRNHESLTVVQYIILFYLTLDILTLAPLDSFCVMKLRLEHESYDSYNVHFPIYCQSYGYFINDSFYHPELTGGKKKT